MSQGIKRLISRNSMWMVLIAMIIVVSFIVPSFCTVTNAMNILMTESIRGILALGVMFTMITAGIDLSSGAVAALSSVISSSFVQQATYSARLYPNLDLGGLSVPVAFLTGLGVGALIGLINGLLVAYTDIHPFIATLGTQLIARAVAYLYTNAFPVPMLKNEFTTIGGGTVGGVFPNVALVFIVVAVIAWFMLSKTRFGKSIYAIGGNRTAAETAGIKVKKDYVLVYTWASFCAGLGGVLLAARSGSGIATLATGYELDAIAAATVGGVSQRGGAGRVSGCIAGILVLGVVSNVLLLLGISPYIQQIVTGTIIIAAVVIDVKRTTNKI